MPKGRHKLAHQKGSFGHFALVELEVLPESGVGKSPVRISFERLGNLDPGLDFDWKASVIDGIRYAFSKLGPGVSKEDLSVHVTDVRGMIVDTAPDSLKYAAAFAVWAALGVTPVDPPSIDSRSKQIVFPG